MSGGPRGRRRATKSVMRTDDIVAPGIRRYRAAWITGAALVLVVVAIVWITLSLERAQQETARATDLTAEEVQSFRDFVATRGQVRDAERDRVQAQLNEQRAALCQAIATMSDTAEGVDLDTLAQARVDLSCDSLPAVGVTTPPP